MIRRSLCAALLLYAAVALAPGAHADATSEARKAIQAAYDRMDAAAARKDIDAMSANAAPDYVGVTQSGQKFTLAQVRAQWATVFVRVRSIKATTTIQKFRMKGPQAIVTARSYGEMMLVNPQNHRTAKVTMDETTEDTWIRSTKGWLATRTKTISQTWKRNGKPVYGGGR